MGFSKRIGWLSLCALAIALTNSDAAQPQFGVERPKTDHAIAAQPPPQLSAPLAQTVKPLKLTPHRITLATGKTFNLNLPDDLQIRVAAQGLKRVRFMAKSPDDRIFVTDMYDLTDNQKGSVYILKGFRECL